MLARFAGDPVRLLGLRPAGEAQLPAADGHAGEAAQAEPEALAPRALLEVRRVSTPRSQTCSQASWRALSALSARDFDLGNPQSWLARGD